MNICLKNIIYMKYGQHAGEKPDAIVERKLKEIEKCGYSFWGYGGNLCHPVKSIQPFLKNNSKNSEKTYLILEKINTVWNGSTYKSNFFSRDKKKWEPIPQSIAVYGSKNAIVCKSFMKSDISIDLSKYLIPVGNSKGRYLDDYIRGRVTKGFGVYYTNDEVYDFRAPKYVKVSIVAEVDDAVFLD